MEYFLIFTISICFAYLADKTYSNKILFLFYSIATIGPLVLMAGLRKETVGVDTMAYPYETYQLIENHLRTSSFSPSESVVEPLYYVICYVFIKLFGNNFSSILIGQHLLIICFFYFGLLKIRKLVPIWFGIFFFCFYLYSPSIVAQRQFVSVTLCFWGTTMLLNRQIWLPCLFFVLAFFIHRGSISSLLLIPFIYWRNPRTFKYIIAFIAIVAFGYMAILNYIVGFDAFQKYQTYAISGDYDSAFSITEFLTRIYFISILLLERYRYKSDSLYYAIISISCCEFVLNSLQIYSAFIGRIGMPLFVMYVFGLFVYCFNKGFNKHSFKYRRFALAFFIMLSVYFWWHVWIGNRAGNIYPYHLM